MIEGLQKWLIPYAELLIGLAPRGSLRVTSVIRTRAHQEKLYAARQAGQWPYPVAPPGCSQHEYGYAWDMVGDAALLRELGAIWKSWGGQWGESDPIHFGLRGGVC